MKLRIRYADQVVGAFVLIAFTMLAFILVAVGSQQRWFARDYRFESRLTSTAGIMPGSPILLAGFQVGRISSISLNDNNEAEVSFVIYDTFVDKVRENSILELVTSPVGLGSQLLFQPGKSARVLPEHSFIPSLDTPEGRRLVEQGLVDRPPKDDTITQLLSNVSPLLENVNGTVIELEKLLSQVNGAVGGQSEGPVAEAMLDAAKAVAGINTLIAELNRTMAAISPNIDTIVTDMAATTGSLSVIGKNFEKTSAAMADPTGLVPKLLDPKGSLKTLLDDNGVLFGRVDNSLASIEGTLDNLQGATAALAEQMPQITATIEEARKAIVSAQDVMEGLKNNPLLRGGIPERVEPQSAPTSLRTTDF
jgi:phospholipid/cholesterol/gamma-HCH transport system substrate-binding protein